MIQYTFRGDAIANRENFQSQTCSMAPKEGNSIVKHGVLDERLNVHDVKGLKVADLSICPDNVGCNTYAPLPCPSTTLSLSYNCILLTLMMQVFDRSSHWREVRHACSGGPRLLGSGVGHEGARLPRAGRATSFCPALNSIAWGGNVFTTHDLSRLRGRAGDNNCVLTCFTTRMRIQISFLESCRR